MVIFSILNHFDAIWDEIKEYWAFLTCRKKKIIRLQINQIYFQLKNIKIWIKKKDYVGKTNAEESCTRELMDFGVEKLLVIKKAQFEREKKRIRSAFYAHF